jgi:hypothetical protein
MTLQRLGRAISGCPIPQGSYHRVTGKRREFLHCKNIVTNILGLTCRSHAACQPAKHVAPPLCAARATLMRRVATYKTRLRGPAS